jgi:RND family efflux transporter MFP subunit
VYTVGLLEALDQVDITAELSSTVQDISVGVGDEVKKGQLLVRLDDSTQGAQVGQALAGIERAQGALNQKIAGASQESIDQAFASMKQAEAQYNSAKETFEKNKKALDVNLETKRLAYESALNSTGAAQSTSDIALQSAKDTLVSALAQTELTLRSNLITATDLQYAHFLSCSSTVCAEITSSKQQLVAQAYGSTAGNAGRFNSQTIASLDFVYTESDIRNTQTMAGIDTIAADLDLMVKQLRDTLAKIRVGTSSVHGGNVSSTELANLAAAQSSTETLASTITQAQSTIKNALVNGSSTETSNEITITNAKNAYELAQSQYENDLGLLQASLASAQASLERAIASYESVVTDPRDVDLASLRASVSEASSIYSLYEANRQKAYIRAPFDAKVVTLNVSNGELVNMGTRIVSLVNDSGLQVSAFVNEEQRKNIRVGDRVIVEDSLSGSVLRISPSVDPVTRKIEVVVAVDADNANQLTIGQYVSLTIESDIQTSSETVQLPLSAIYREIGQTSILYVQDNKIEKLPVAVGKISNDAIEVILEAETELPENIIAQVRGLEIGQSVTIK